MTGPLHDCYGRNMHNDIVARKPSGDGTYYSPEEYKFMRSRKGVIVSKNGVIYRHDSFVCDWPACDCPLRSVSGAFRHEKIDWIVEQRARDKSFKVKVRI